jgi:hypothetical protein
MDRNFSELKIRFFKRLEFILVRISLPLCISSFVSRK